MSYDLTERKPLLHYSENDERANVFDSDSFDSSMPRKRSKKARKGKVVKGLKGVRVTKGRVSFRLSGYSGIQRLSPSQLVRFIPLAKLKQAAKRVLQKTGGKKIKRKRKGKRKNKK